MIGWIAGGLAAVGLGVAVWWWLRSRREPGIVSVVMLNTRARTLGEAEVRGAVRRALGVTVQLTDEPFREHEDLRGFVVVENGPPVGVLSVTRRYLEDEESEQVLKAFTDTRLRRAVSEHVAWVSVDAMGVDLGKLKKEQRWRMYDEILGKIAAELVDESCLAFYFVSEGLWAGNTDENLKLMREGRCQEAAGDVSFGDRVVQTKEDDEEIDRAIREAQSRLPEFVSAIEDVALRKGPVFVKGKFTAADGDVEWLWCEVLGVESDGFAVEVANQAIREELPQRGNHAKVRLDDVGDWMYVDSNGKTHGGFVERAIQKR